MRYLMLKRCDGIYEFIPLEQIAFGFIETDEREYRVEITIGGKYTETLFEKRYFDSPTMYACMKKLAKMEDGTVVTVGDLFEE